MPFFDIKMQGVPNLGHYAFSISTKLLFLFLFFRKAFILYDFILEKYFLNFV
jgi:hypothetical protein